MFLMKMLIGFYCALLSSLALPHCVHAKSAAVGSDSSAEWILCQELIGHIATVNKHVGLKHPHQVAGYSSGKTCNLVLNHLQKNVPRALDVFVNLSTHLRRGRELHARARIENVAANRRRANFFGLGADPEGCEVNYMMSNPATSVLVSAQGILLPVCGRTFLVLISNDCFFRNRQQRGDTPL